jgi:RNA polymerase sigma-70 factor, ECF subfamily
VKTTDPSADRSIPREVIASAIDGDELAQVDLYGRLRPLIFGILRLLTGRTAVPEELCTDMAVTVFARLGTFRWRSSFSTWVHSIVVRRYWKVWHKERVRRVAAACGELGPEITALPLPDDLAATREVASVALEAVANLPPRMQESFLMLDIERFEPEEVARHLCTSVGAVQDCAYRARLRIREHLRERGLMGDSRTEPVPGTAAEAAIGAEPGNIVSLRARKGSVDHG